MAIGFGADDDGVDFAVGVDGGEIGDDCRVQQCSIFGSAVGVVIPDAFDFDVIAFWICLMKPGVWM